MEERTIFQMSISDESLSCCDALAKTGFFNNRNTAIGFAVSVALRKELYLNIDFEKYEIPSPKKSNNLHSSQIPKHTFLFEIIQILDFKTDLSNSFKILADLGFKHINEIIKNEEDFLIGDLL